MRCAPHEVLAWSQCPSGFGGEVGKARRIQNRTEATKKYQHHSQDITSKGPYRHLAHTQIYIQIHIRTHIHNDEGRLGFI